MAETTPWFDGDVRPVHVGVYQKLIGTLTEPSFAYWDGVRWGAFVGRYDSPDDAYFMRDVASAYQNTPWRGLAQKAGQ